MQFSDRFNTIEEIEDWYEDQFLALTEYKSKQVQFVVSGTGSSSSKFAGMSLDELNAYFDESFEELEFMVSFNLLSAVEAHIRMDFHTRIKKKKNKPLVKEYRKLWEKKGAHIALEGDLLSALKMEYPLHKRAFSDYIGALKFRHWIAHGRYWVPKFGMNYNATKVLPIVTDTMQALESIAI